MFTQHWPVLLKEIADRSTPSAITAKGATILEKYPQMHAHLIIFFDSILSLNGDAIAYINYVKWNVDAYTVTVSMGIYKKSGAGNSLSHPYIFAFTLPNNVIFSDDIFKSYEIYSNDKKIRENQNLIDQLENQLNSITSKLKKASYTQTELIKHREILLK